MVVTILYEFVMFIVKGIFSLFLEYRIASIFDLATLQQPSLASSGIHTANQRNLLKFRGFLRHWTTCVQIFIQEQTNLLKQQQRLFSKFVVFQDILSITIAFETDEI